MEAALGNTVLKFEKEYFGRGPKEISTYIVKDMVIIRQKGILTPAKEKVRDNPESVGLIQRLRETLLKNNQEVLPRRTAESHRLPGGFPVHRSERGAFGEVPDPHLR